MHSIAWACKHSSVDFIIIIFWLQSFNFFYFNILYVVYLTKILIRYHFLLYIVFYILYIGLDVFCNNFCSWYFVKMTVYLLYEMPTLF